jgi:hypothetical protein
LRAGALGSCALARILIIGGGRRGRALAEASVGDGHAVRITTRSEAGRDAIEASGAECWIGTPDRLATLRGALDSVTIACWMLASATGTPEQLGELHGTRLELFLTQAIDTTVRGLIYEVGPRAAEEVRAGEQTVRSITARNEIPAAFLTADPADRAAWLGMARGQVDRLLAHHRPPE